MDNLMKEGGSKIPDKCKFLLEHGWVTHYNHDNWVKKEFKDTPQVDDMCIPMNSAYDILCAEELEKCIASPYYFATNYLKVKTTNGESIQWTTEMSEEEFNKLLQNTDKYVLLKST